MSPLASTSAQPPSEARPSNPRPAPLSEDIRRKLPDWVECMAYRVEPGRYRAICLDFSLVAESSESMLDAQHRLVDQIADYLEDVIREGCPPHLVQRGLTRLERIHLRAVIAWLGLKGLAGALVPIRVNGERADWKQPIGSAC